MATDSFGLHLEVLEGDSKAVDGWEHFFHMRKTGNRVCCVFEAHEQHGLLSFWAVWVKFWSGVEVLVSGFYFSGARFLPWPFLFHSYSSFFSVASVSVNIRFQPNCQLLEMRPSGALAVGRPMKRKL